MASGRVPNTVRMRNTNAFSDCSGIWESCDRGICLLSSRNFLLDRYSVLMQGPSRQSSQASRLQSLTNPAKKTANPLAVASPFLEILDYLNQL